MNEIFREIDQYWSNQRNNEIYLKNKNLVAGSLEYFQEIECQRFKYIYYLPSILKHFQRAPGKRLLEIGCGMGIDLSFFAREGFDAYGIDLAATHVELAKKLFEIKNQRATIIQMNAECLDFQKDFFDCVYSLGVLHHTQTPQKGIDEIYRVLKSNGRCSVMVYHRHSLNNLIHILLRLPFDNIKDFKPFGTDAHFVHRFSKREIRNMFSNFKKVEIKTEYVYGAGWEPIYSLTPKTIYKILSKLLGWHLVIYAEK